MATRLFNWLLRRKPTPVPVSTFPYKIAENPYRCKRTWPPDFNELSLKHQFSIERRYKRRAKMAYTNETWNKWTKIFQWGSIIFVAVYGTFFMEVDDEGRTMLQALREDFQDYGANIDKKILQMKMKQREEMAKKQEEEADELARRAVRNT